MVSFEATETGVRVSDAIERRQCRLHTGEDVTPVSADTDDFRFPVDDAIALTTDSLTFPDLVATYVRDDDGKMLAELEHFSSHEFSTGQYSIELCAPVKLYVRVEGTLTVSASATDLTIETDAETILVGARSHHDHPAATITTTNDPHDLMQALSAFGSALKTTSPERSYPTLRGHPPLLEQGDELSIPDGLSTPETGIRLELPPDRDYIYPAATLAYYLGAEVVPGDGPRIVTDQGFVYPLDTTGNYEEEVARTLKQVFFLDCVTRTEGFYEVDLHERQAVEGRLGLDFAALYDQNPATRLESYLSVAFDDIAAHIPEWKLTTHLAPSAENAELLPFLVDDLAVIRLPEQRDTAVSEAQLAAINDFTRDFTRSASGESAAPSSVVEPKTTDSLEQAWAGKNAPMGASKASVQAFHNRLDRERADGDIDITVVCNDTKMDDERNLAEDIYGSREDFPFDVQVYHDLSTTALRAVLETDIDYLHYIGHIDNDGFDCADGKLDAADLDSVGVDAFFLNACSSYDQGMALIDGGAIGGVVTLADVINSGAVRVGRTMARLLNQGFPLRAALTIASEESIVGSHYIVVGDGNLDVVQSVSGQPALLDVAWRDDCFEVRFRTFPTSNYGMGSSNNPLCGDGTHYLGSGTIDTFELTTAELDELLGAEALPVQVDQELYWSSDITAEDLRDHQN